MLNNRVQAYLRVVGVSSIVALSGCATAPSTHNIDNADFQNIKTIMQMASRGQCSADELRWSNLSLDACIVKKNQIVERCGELAHGKLNLDEEQTHERFIMRYSTCLVRQMKGLSYSNQQADKMYQFIQSSQK